MPTVYPSTGALTGTTSNVYSLNSTWLGTSGTTVTPTQIDAQAWAAYAQQMAFAAQQANQSMVNFGTALTTVTQTISSQINNWANTTFVPLVNRMATYGSNVRFDAYQYDYGSGLEWRNGVARQMSDREILHRQRADRRAKVQRRKAAQRGAKLLLRLLTDQQQIEYARTGKITVLAADGRTFRLRKGRTAELLDGREVVASYCIHPSGGGWVAEDTLICQLMSLQNDPAEFEKIANISHHRQPAAAPVVPLRRAA